MPALISSHQSLFAAALRTVVNVYYNALDPQVAN